MIVSRKYQETLVNLRRKMSNGHVVVLDLDSRDENSRIGCYRCEHSVEGKFKRIIDKEGLNETVYNFHINCLDKLKRK